MYAKIFIKGHSACRFCITSILQCANKIWVLIEQSVKIFSNSKIAALFFPQKYYFIKERATV